MSAWWLLPALAVVLVFAAVGNAAAAPQLDGTFNLTGPPDRLTLGPDGNVWFTLQTSSDNKQFGKVTPDGTVTEFQSPSNVTLVGIAAGPDHNLWATTINGVVRIDPSNPTGAQTFTDANIGGPQDIAAGPDGNLWTGSGSDVISIAPTTPAPKFTDHLGLVTQARGIAAGGDGNMWIDDFNAADSAVVRFTTGGTLIKSTKVGGGPQGITAGPPGQLAYTNPTASPQEIGRIDYAGNVGHTTVPTGTDPFGIVFAHDGAYWTAEFGANALGRLTTDGAHTQPIMFGAGNGPRRVTLGAGDTLWVGLETAQKIARITGVSAPVTTTTTGGGGGAVGSSPSTLATVSNAGESNGRFRVAPKFRSVSATRRRPPVGTTFKYTLDKPASVRFDFTQGVPGRKVNGKCVAQNKRNKRKRKCTRTIIRGTLSFSGHAGQNTVRFSGWLSKHKKLKPGKYTLVITATTPGVGSTSQKLTFTIVK